MPVTSSFYPVADWQWVAAASAVLWRITPDSSAKKLRFPVEPYVTGLASMVKLTLPLPALEAKV